MKASIRPVRLTRSQRGFTLIELVVVVVIIGITAALATPSVVEQMRERRARDAAQKVALVYTNARMRARGRGAAVLVSFSKASGTFTIKESIEGAAAVTARAAAADCAQQPGMGCLTTNWGTDSRSIETLTIDSSFFDFKASDQAGAPQDFMDICFTPMGRSFVSFAGPGTSPTVSMAGAATFSLTRKLGGGTYGVLEDGQYWRKVVILPNGTARVAL